MSFLNIKLFPFHIDKTMHFNNIDCILNIYYKKEKKSKKVYEIA